jgi:outer membrane beta-barrel protein
MQPWNTSLLVAMIVVGFSTSTYAQSKKKAQAPAKATVEAPAAQPAANADADKVDISDLEKKYWAPKDTDFSVVQNRTYSKDGKFLFTFQAGPIINDSYREGMITGGTVNYFFNERHGVQLNYHMADLDTNQATKDLAQYGSGVQPDHGSFTSHYGLGYTWVPFYAKMSFLGSKILYFDMAFTPHIGMTTYDQTIRGGDKSQSSLTYGIDFTQYFFIANNIAIRMDLKNQWFNEEVVGYSNVNEGIKLRDQNTQNTMFLLGLTLYFN